MNSASGPFESEVAFEAFPTTQTEAPPKGTFGDISEKEFKRAVSSAFTYIRTRAAAELGIRTESDNHEASLEAAVSLIMDGGYDANDSDLFGSDMSDIVQALLQCAIMLQPDMVDMWREKGIL